MCTDSLNYHKETQLLYYTTYLVFKYITYRTEKNKTKYFFVSENWKEELNHRAHQMSSYYFLRLALGRKHSHRAH